jgi:hypothetical protein
MAYFSTKPRGYVKTGKVSDKHNLGRMPKEKVGNPITGVNKFASVSRKLQEDDTTDDPFLPDPRGKGMIYRQKPQHRLPGEQSFKESTLKADLLGETDRNIRAGMMEDERRDSVKRAGDANRKRRLKKQKGLKEGGMVGRATGQGYGAARRGPNLV